MGQPTTSTTILPPTLWPGRWWWAVFFFILILAGGLRYTGYDFSLPYIDHPNEPSHLIAAQMTIDTGSAKPIGEHGYPPGIVTLNTFLLKWFHDPQEPFHTITGTVRLISVIFSTATVAVVGLLGYRVSTPLAGLIAGLLWAVEPTAIGTSHIATGDSAHIFFTTAAMLLVLTGTRFNRSGWSTAAVFAIMLAILFKYQAIFSVPIILMLPLLRLWTPGVERSTVLRSFIYDALRLSVFFFWLLLIFPALESGASPGNFEGSPEYLALPTFDALVANARAVSHHLQTLWIPGLISLALLLWRSYRQRNWLIGLGVLALNSLLWLIGMSFFGTPKVIQFIAAEAVIVTLLGVGLAGWEEALCTAASRVQQLQIESLRPAYSAIVIAAILLATWGQVKVEIEEALERTLPDRRNDLMAWADTTLDSGPYVSDVSNHKTFNGAWGGYTGQTEFPFFVEAFVDERPIKEWRDAGVQYAVIPYWYYEQMQQTPEGQAYLGQMTLLKAYLPSEAYRGPDMAFFYLYPIEHPLTGELGLIRFLGYNADTPPSPGEVFRFRLFWLAQGPTEGVYRVYNHLVRLPAREPVAQIDGPPLPTERRATSDWTDPAETLMSRTFEMMFPADLEPGTYQLITGFYHADTQQRLVAADGQDYVVMLTVEIGN